MASLQGLAVCRRHFAARFKRFRFILHLTPYALLLSLLFVSTAGAGWVRQTSNTTLSLRDVCFVDSLCGWAVGGWSSANPSDTFLGICLRTTDGGVQWDTSYYYETRNGVLSVVSFVSRTHGWMMSDSALNLTTTDGGLTWSSMFSLGWFVPFTMRFVNDSSGYLTGGSPWMGILDGADVGRTVDGGNTWNWRQPMARQPAWLVGLDVQGPRWAWSTGQWDSMALTRDGGETWLINYLSNSGVNMYNGVAFGDTAIGVAVGYSVSSPIIARTSNGGLTWSQRSISGPRDLLSVEMADTLLAWTCGGGGAIIASTDGGMNWTAQVSGTRAQLRKIWFVDARQGWAVGDSGVILHTEDGGHSGVWENHQGSFQPLTSNLSFSVFPNPFVSFTSVPGHSSNRFALYDISGRKVGVYKGNRVGEGLASGVYFLKSEGQESKPLRIMKLR